MAPEPQQNQHEVQPSLHPSATTENHGNLQRAPQWQWGGPKRRQAGL